MTDLDGLIADLRNGSGVGTADVNDRVALMDKAADALVTVRAERDAALAHIAELEDRNQHLLSQFNGLKLVNERNALEARIAELESLVDQMLLPAQKERAAIDWWISRNVAFGPVKSVRDGWHEAICDCGWSTDGLESIVEDAVYEHAVECMKPSAAGRRADRAEARIVEAAKLHVEVECDEGCLYGVGETPGWGVTTNHCAICTFVPWPCPTAVSLGLNEG